MRFSWFLPMLAIVLTLQVPPFVRHFTMARWADRGSFAVLMNLPGMVIAVPAQLAIWHRAAVPDPFRVPWLIWSAVFSGIPFWWLAGRYVDDAWQLSLGNDLRSPSKLDWCFAIITSGVGIFVTVMLFVVWDTDVLDLGIGGAIWMQIGVSALILRIWQFRVARKSRQEEVAAGS